jgi:hypothetical protein
MSYIGNSPTSVPFIADSFSGNSSTTSFTPLTRAPAGTASIAVFIAGVYQAPGTYTLSGVTITFATAPATGTNNIIVLHLGTGSVAQVTSDGSVTLTKLSGDTFSYINSAFTAANTPSYTANSGASYANSSFSTANSSASYANSAFLSANTPSNVANSAASYANGAFAKANTAAVGTYVTNSNNVILSANTQITANITILPNTGGLSIGPITLDANRTVTVSANSRWLVL